ncbi:unnamed protein product [Prunus armeniaca]|uniref:Reverse transcriptase Ty1/copia-type domain-containing protein n=1 Tax=Prunus armeniaca TaxID=36596 RepID=A0A6J5WQL1_PRUAR|nr:unnamed protein product [Prunus armeniaca]CAB4304020.1 unnamed protein product [Prunus armeniaca]
MESQCVSIIQHYSVENIINNFMDEDSVPALWEKLEKLYMAKGLTNKLYMTKQLYTLKMEEGGNLMDHINVFSGCIDQLRKVDVKLEEEDKALLLLTSLPDSYENLVTTLFSSKDTMSLEQVQVSLVSHDTQKKIFSGDGGHESTLAVEEGNRGRTFDGRFERDSRFISSSKGRV